MVDIEDRGRPSTFWSGAIAYLPDEARKVDRTNSNKPVLLRLVAQER